MSPLGSGKRKHPFPCTLEIKNSGLFHPKPHATWLDPSAPSCTLPNLQRPCEREPQLWLRALEEDQQTKRPTPTIPPHGVCVCVLKSLLACKWCGGSAKKQTHDLVGVPNSEDHGAMAHAITGLLVLEIVIL